MLYALTWIRYTLCKFVNRSQRYYRPHHSSRFRTARYVLVNSATSGEICRTYASCSTVLTSFLRTEATVNVIHLLIKLGDIFWLVIRFGTRAIQVGPQNRSQCSRSHFGPRNNHVEIRALLLEKFTWGPTILSSNTTCICLYYKCTEQIEMNKN